MFATYEHICAQILKYEKVRSRVGYSLRTKLGAFNDLMKLNKNSLRFVEALQYSRHNWEHKQKTINTIHRSACVRLHIHDMLELALGSSCVQRSNAKEFISSTFFLFHFSLQFTLEVIINCRNNNNITFRRFLPCTMM